MEISQTLENKRLATRDKLLKAAITLLKSGGHSALRFSAVADLAGISRGGLLHHFPTKEALVAAVFEVIVREQETDSLKRIESFDGGDILQALIDDATFDYTMGESDAALQKLSRATSEAPESFAAWHALAEINFSLRRLDAASTPPSPPRRRRTRCGPTICSSTPLSPASGWSAVTRPAPSISAPRPRSKAGKSS